MNKIIIENDQIIESNIDYIYNEKQSLFDISELILDIKDDTNLILKINFKEESKLIITFSILENANFNLSIITTGSFGKVQYKYNLDKNSTCHVEKFNDVENIREMIVANLDEMSNFEYYFKSIVTNSENYDYMIYHNGVKSNSNIYNGSVNENGKIYYQISSFIPKDIVGCVANQFNRIINLTDNKCEIRPNLYIDCDDVEANHSALIDKFMHNELFYLKLRGINEEDAIKMLTKGFLLSKIKNKEIIDLINKRYGGE